MRSIALAAAAALTALTGSAVAQTTVALSCSPVTSIEYELCERHAREWESLTGNRVKFVREPSGLRSPKDNSRRLAYYLDELTNRPTKIDVLQIDMVWVSVLADYLLDLSGSTGPGVIAQHFNALIENNTVNGRLVAMPWFVNAGLLYYRQDLLREHKLEVPETWEDLEKTARTVMERERERNRQIWGYVFQGAAYEGLTVNALEWLDSYNAPNIVELRPGSQAPSVKVNDRRTIEALTMAASWIGTIAPRDVLNYGEVETHERFQRGEAVFMRNWPYAWKVVNGEDSLVRGKVGVTALPRGGQDGKHTGVFGGEQLAVSKHSTVPSEAVSLVRYLTSRAQQKRRAIDGAFNPTIGELYRDHEVLTANPFFSELYSTFSNAVARPSVVARERYAEVSKEFQTTVHSVLSNQNGDVGHALGKLERTLERIMSGQNTHPQAGNQ